MRRLSERADEDLSCVSGCENGEGRTNANDITEVESIQLGI